MNEIKGKIKHIEQLIQVFDSDFKALERKIHTLIKTNSLIKFNFLLYEIPIDIKINYAGVELLKTKQKAKEIYITGKYPAGQELKVHFHDFIEEIKVLEGEFLELVTWQILKKGDKIKIPAMVTHGFKNISKKTGFLKIKIIKK